MKRLLRSVIDFGDTKQEYLLKNLQKLQASKLEWVQPVDEKVYGFVISYFQQRLEVPSGQTIKDWFDGQNDVEAAERLKDIEAAPPYIQSNFTHLLEALLDEQNKIKTIALIKETHEIVARGLVMGEGKNKERVQGVRAGVQHFTSHINDIIVSEHNARVSGDIRNDGQEVWNSYVSAKLNKDKVWGKFTGLNNLDKVCHGIKKGELWIHAAYPGELKTSFGLNWCYNLVTRYKTNILYVSLEMPYEQVRLIVYVIHSSHPKWALEGYCPLDYRKVRDGELTEAEEAFWQKVIADFDTNPEYCKFEIWTPENGVSMDDVKLQAELYHRQWEVGLIVLDHAQWLLPTKRNRHKDYTIELNSIVRDVKQTALRFNHREGVAILLLFQINRNGKDEADKNEGRYKLKALTYANEAEKAADVITTTYLNDEHRKNSTTLFCNLKNRDNPIVEPFIAQADMTSRRIKNQTTPLEGRGMSVEVHGEAQALMNMV